MRQQKQQQQQQHLHVAAHLLEQRARVVEVRLRRNRHGSLAGLARG